MQKIRHLVNNSMLYRANCQTIWGEGYIESESRKAHKSIQTTLFPPTKTTTNPHVQIYQILFLIFPTILECYKRL